jgi:hypothetical protein
VIFVDSMVNDGLEALNSGVARSKSVIDPSG